LDISTLNGPVGNVAIADVFARRSAAHNLNMVSSASVPMATAIPRSQRRLIRFHPSPVITPHRSSVHSPRWPTRATMTGTSSLPVPVPLNPVNSGLAASRPAPVRPHAEGDRVTLLAQASRLQDRARISAQSGDISSAAQFILQALDHERRAGGLGPQVLQLIKPR
jgi:hypothetical protein